MAEFYLYGKKIETIFGLLGRTGRTEDDLSRSLGWALKCCLGFLRRFLQSICEADDFDAKEVAMELQLSKKKQGRTDVEINIPGKLRIIIEAKRWLALPGSGQLKTYAQRLENTNAATKILIVLSDCSVEFACTRIPGELSGIKVKYISWTDVYEVAKRSLHKDRGPEKYILNELTSYLKELIEMQEVDSNWVFVVSLGSGTPAGWGISWREIVNKKGRYFHPVGNRWPQRPPNYLAFRYDGKLQSIHHVESYEVTTNFHEHIDEIPSHIEAPHFIYKLGPAFRPDHTVPTGNIYPSGRAKCMLDTLFTCKTIAAARDLSRKREANARQANSFT